MQKFCDYIEKGYKFFFYLSGLFLGGMFVICAYSVITRLVATPSVWADELIRFLMVFMAFAGAPWMINTKTDLVVDLTEIFFPKRKKLLHKTHLIGELILLAILIYLIFPTWQLSIENMTSKTSALQWTLGYVYMCMPVSFVFCAIAQVKNIIKSLIQKTTDVTVKEE